MHRVITTAARVHLHPGLFVGVTAQGFALPAERGGGVFRLAADDLAMLARLADPSSEHEEVDSSLLEELRLRGVVGALTEPVPSRPFEDLPRSSPCRSEGTVRVITPLTIEPVPGGFRWHDGFTGRGVELTVTETLVAGAFVVARTVPEGLAVLDGAGGSPSPPEDLVRSVLGRLEALGLVLTDEAHSAARTNVTERLRREELERNRTLFRAVAAANGARPRPKTGTVVVVPVAYPLHLPPLSLGLILAHAQSYQGGRLAEHYDLVPRWHARVENVDRVLAETGPAVFLFSHYVWSSDRVLEVSRRVKELSPDSITVHGGPNVPRQAADLEQWMGEHGHVDVAVRNEGEEATAELLAALAGHLPGHRPGHRVGVDGSLPLPDLLGHVAGLTVRGPTGLTRTGDRPRAVDLDSIPSPYLSGVFEPWEHAGVAYMTIETNRGCPYGCTFCDWGQVTLSRIRTFDLERVFAEIEWAGRLGASRVHIADANFGIFARDVEIARRIAEVRQRTGFPREVLFSFAKNTMKHITEIVRILVEADVITCGSVSLQTTDPHTLEAVARKNIRTERYWELAALFREQKLPLLIELMMGLPGATPEAFDNDLQHCVDIEVQPRIHRTEVLVNSPMNEPEYRRRFAIRTEDVHTPAEDVLSAARTRRLLVSSSSFSAADMADMVRQSESFAIFESYGVARHIARWARQVTGRREIEIYRDIDDAARTRADRYPVLAWLLETVHGHAAVPLQWRYLYDEVRRLLVTELGLPDGSGIETVCRVQEALMPARGRRFPTSINLAHDYVRWHAHVVSTKEQGVLDWTGQVPRLEDLPPGALTVDDPHGLCEAAIGIPVDMFMGDNWELDSPVSRTALKFRNI